MKTTFLIIVLMLTVVISGIVSAQDTVTANLTPYKKVTGYLNKNKVSLSCAFIAGFAEGNREILRHDYEAFKRVFPGANDKFWNPAISWQNKWKNGDPAQGEKFFGSTSFLVATTDGTHLAGSIRNLAWVGTVTFKIGEKKKWYLYLLDAGTHWLAYSAGFNLTYHGIYKHPVFKAKSAQ